MKTPKRRPEKTSEAALIRKLRKTAPAQARRSGVQLGIGDDAALFTPRRGYKTILTCDWFLEGTHFLRDRHSADAVGWKSLARALSDVAAMGGEPRCFLLSLALPETHAGRWLSEFLAGLRRAARKFNCPLAGGDTTRHSKILINITVVGEVPADRPSSRSGGGRTKLRSGRAVPLSKGSRAILRSGARPSDILYVSGRLGEAELGLLCSAGARSRTPSLLRQLLRSRPHLTKNSPPLKKHLYPEPRIALGRWLADRRLATSMMDLSDGLSADLPRLCASSHVGARIEAAEIPTVRLPTRTDAKSTKSNRSSRPLDPEGQSAAALDLALNGGDDYELLFTVRSGDARRLPAAFRGVPLTPVGVVTRQPGISLVQPDGRTEPLRPRGWDPFR
jgi:thiamine-monophosphate kinase